MAHVFLSYTREDSEVAAALAIALTAQTGRTVWSDRSLQPGEDWDQKISSALDDASEVLVLFSPKSMESQWVKGEAHKAYNQHKPVIPVIIDGFDPREIPPPFNVMQWVDLRDWVPSIPHSGLDALVHRLTRASHRQSRALWDQLRQLLPLCLPFAFVAFLFMAAGFFDLFGLDAPLRFVALSARELRGTPQVDPQLLLVVIDGKSEKKLAPYDAVTWRAKQASALRKLTRARVVAYDFTFKASQDSRAVQPTAELAGMIREARGLGTSIVVAESLEDGVSLIDPAIVAALSESLAPSGGRPAGTGIRALACIGLSWKETAGTVPLAVHRAATDSSMPSLALATYQSFRGMKLGPISERAEIGLLKGDVEKERISFAGYEAPVERDQLEGCRTLSVGDRPARYYLDLFPIDVRRGHPQVIAFEDVLAETFNPERVRDKIVLVGRQADREDVAHLWSRGSHSTHGVNVHAGAINTLLSKQFITRMGALEQLAWLCVLALGAAAIRTKVAPRRRLRRALLLSLLVLVDLAFAVCCSLRGLITDLPYQLLVIVLSYRLSGRMSWIWLNFRDLARKTRAAEPTRG